MRCWLKESSVLEMSISDAAWLAGFLDGEGSISDFMGGRDCKYRTWRLSAPNTVLKSLQKCKRIAGVGNICVKQEKTDRKKKQWQWQLGAQRDIKKILEQVLPYLVIKRNKAKRFLRLFKEL
jgi:hypothetical protein